MAALILLWLFGVAITLLIAYLIIKAAVKAAIKESFQDLNLIPPQQDQSGLP